MMPELKSIQKKYCSQAMFVAIVATLVFFFLGLKPVGKGVLLGSVFSVVNFVLIAQALPMHVGSTHKRSVMISIGSIWVRFIIMAIPLVISLKSAMFDVFGVAAGLFMVQAVIMVNHLARLVRAA